MLGKLSDSNAMPQVWVDCIDQLKTRVSAVDLNTWVAPLHPVRRDDTLKLLAPNRYVLDYVNKNFSHLITEILAAMDSGIKSVQVEIGGHSVGHVGGGSGGKSGVGKNMAGKTKTAATRYAAGAMDSNYTFAKHIEGESNALARAAALQVGNKPGGAGNFNPLFIYGEVGLGKTHLMQASGHLMLHNDPGARVIYVRSELFVNDMIKALSSKAMHDFKRHYRSPGALLIDDIQFFARKTQSQEEFFHTFNTLIEGRQQIIITSDRTPQAITDVDPRLVSRFSAGLTIGIEPPEMETRVAILKNKAREQKIELPDEVAQFVAGVIRSNVRELEGALHSILANARFTGRDIDTELAQQALRDRLAHQQRQTSIENIQQTVAEYHKLRMADMLSKKRSRNIARPRQLAMYFAKEYTNLSLPQIGERFGGRDHSTVIHACRKINELLKTDAKIQIDHRNLRRLFGG